MKKRKLNKRGPDKADLVYWMEHWMECAIRRWRNEHVGAAAGPSVPPTEEGRRFVVHAILEATDARYELMQLTATKAVDHYPGLTFSQVFYFVEQFWTNERLLAYLRDHYAGDRRVFDDLMGRERDKNCAARAFCRNLRGHKSPNSWEAHKPNLHLMALGRCGDLMTMNALDTLDVDFFNSGLGEPNWTSARDYVKQLTKLDHAAELAFATAFWCGSGFSSVGIAHRLAAALMFTKTPDDPKPPWFGFVVKVPDGLLTHEVGGSLRTMLVSRWPDADLSATSGVGTAEPHRPDRWYIFFQWERGSISYLHLPTLGAFDRAGFVAAVPRGSGSHKDLDRRQRYRFARAHELALNLVGGMCLLMADKAALKSTKKSNSKNRNRPYRSLPFETATYVVAKNVEIDLRPQVQQYVEGGKKTSTGDRKLTCQFPVRGHWRNQACGAAMADRRLIWVSPFWKGPQESRILLRGYNLDGDRA